MEEGADAIAAPKPLSPCRSTLADADRLDLALILEGIEVTFDDTKNALCLGAGDELRPRYGLVMTEARNAGIAADGVNGCGSLWTHRGLEKTTDDATQLTYVFCWIGKPIFLACLLYLSEVFLKLAHRTGAWIHYFVMELRYFLLLDALALRSVSVCCHCVENIQLQIEVREIVRV